MVVGGACFAVWMAVHPVAAQSPAPFSPGQVVERVPVQTDTTRSYALYLPSRYSPDRAWPVLFILDPRGRAVPALERFRAAAEEFGWIIASSHDSRSDVDEDLNTPAFNALLDDTQRRLRVDTDRLYLAGFSGTAESSWYIAQAMEGHVAGIIAAGYGLPHGIRLQLQAGTTLPFVVYGTAGRTGFNFEDVYDMDTALDQAGLPNQVVYFDGGHEWMPPELAADAVAWLELQAMRLGLRPPDAGFVAARLRALVERVDALVAAGRELEAALLLTGAEGDFPERAEALGRVRAGIEASEKYARQRERRALESREAMAYSRRLRARFGGRAGEGPRVPPDDLAREVEVDALLARASGEDTADAVQARRLLASASVLLSFYGPRDALRKGSPGHALDYLEVAERIDPGSPSLCRFRAFAHAQTGDTEAAVAALRCWAEAADPGPEALRSEPYLRPLRGEPAFEALLREMTGGGASHP